MLAVGDGALEYIGAGGRGLAMADSLWLWQFALCTKSAAIEAQDMRRISKSGREERADHSMRPFISTVDLPSICWIPPVRK